MKFGSMALFSDPRSKHGLYLHACYVSIGGAILCLLLSYWIFEYTLWERRQRNENEMYFYRSWEESGGLNHSIVLFTKAIVCSASN